METSKRPQAGRRALAEQEFNGKVYHLYKGERYFSRGNKRLHRAVWEYYNGPIPAGYQIHHKDGNTANNDISNLECLPSAQHFAEHLPQIIERNTSEKSLRHLAEIRPLTKEWHRSEEGRAWHREHAQGERERKFKCVCQCCGREFLAAKSSARYCSNPCKSKARRDAGADNVVGKCAVCGKEFKYNKYRNVLTCSPSCSAIYRWRVLRDGGSV